MIFQILLLSDYNIMKHINKEIRIKALLLVITTITLLLMGSLLYASPLCGEVANYGPGQYGPFDYTNSGHKKKELRVVESFHFSKDVENLTAGMTGTIGSDISYTLNAFPNHHRALSAMSRLSIRDKQSKPTGAKYSALCYFDRAIRFKPGDAMVRSLYGSHLLELGKLDMALEQLNVALQIDPENPTFNYNLGLLYFERKDYKKAEDFARKAYSQGFPLLGLKNKLIKAGKWSN